MFNKLNSTFGSQLDKAKALADTAMDVVTDFKDAGVDKLNDYIEEISAGMPLIEEAGFKNDGINIGLGLPPDISISFIKTNTVDNEVFERLIEENEEKKLLVMLLNALLTANKIQSKVTFDMFAFSGVSIDLGLPPKVSLRYK